MNKEFHKNLKEYLHNYVLLTYKHTKKYPDDEKFGLTAQDRRSAVSAMLNYIEGFARMRPTVMLNFYENSYGSLKESAYCRYLAFCLGYISHEEYKMAYSLKEKAAPMLYRTMEGLRDEMEK